MNEFISNERKVELVDILTNMKQFWNETYKNDHFAAHREVEFEEPISIWIREKQYTAVNRIGLDAEKNFGEYWVYIRSLEDGRRDLLSWAIKTSELTNEADTNIFMAVSLLGSDLSRQLLDSVKNGPTDDEALNWMLKFS